MEALEFQTTVGKDGVITLPENVVHRVQYGKMRVIILSEEPTKPTFFDRNETNDRQKIRAENFIKYLMYLIKSPVKVEKSVPFLKGGSQKFL